MDKLTGRVQKVRMLLALTGDRTNCSLGTYYPMPSPKIQDQQRGQGTIRDKGISTLPDDTTDGHRSG